MVLPIVHHVCYSGQNIVGAKCLSLFPSKIVARHRYVHQETAVYYFQAFGNEISVAQYKFKRRGRLVAAVDISLNLSPQALHFFVSFFFLHKKRSSFFIRH